MIILPVFSWSDFKSLVSSKDLRPQFHETSNKYEIYADEGLYIWTIALIKNSADATDFVNNHKSSYNTAVSSRDSDGATITRNKAAKRGWTYGVTSLEFKTSRRDDTLYSKLADGTNRSGITLKAYDANDNEVTTDGLAGANLLTIVKTVIEFEPPYDYELIGGYIRTLNDITSDIRLWIIAVPDISAENGGSKEMIGGLNLNYMKPENVFNVDGRASKYMTYDNTYHTNKLKLILKYPAGTTENIAINIEHYKQ